MVNEIEIILEIDNSGWKWNTRKLLQLFSFSSILHFLKSSTSFNSYVVSIVWVHMCVGQVPRLKGWLWFGFK